MKLFLVSFNGHYPVGQAAVVVAEDQNKAYDLAVAMLKEDGLWEDGDTVWTDKNNSKTFTLESLTEVSLEKEEAHMLANGSY